MPNTQQKTEPASSASDEDATPPAAGDESTEETATGKALAAETALPPTPAAETALPPAPAKEAALPPALAAETVLPPTPTAETAPPPAHSTHAPRDASSPDAPDCGGVGAEVITLQCRERCKTGEISYMVRDDEHLTDVIDWPEGDAGRQLDTHGGLCKDLNGKHYFLEGFNMYD